MFNVTGGELFMILVVALVVLGPERLPGAARKIGQMAGQLRDLSDSFKREVAQAMDDPGEPIVKPLSRPHFDVIPGGVGATNPAPSSPDSTADEAPGAAVSEPATSPSNPVAPADSPVWPPPGE